MSSCPSCMTTSWPGTVLIFRTSGSKISRSWMKNWVSLFPSSSSPPSRPRTSSRTCKVRVWSPPTSREPNKRSWTLSKNKSRGLSRPRTMLRINVRSNNNMLNKSSSKSRMRVCSRLSSRKSSRFRRLIRSPSGWKLNRSRRGRKCSVRPSSVSKNLCFSTGRTWWSSRMRVCRRLSIWTPALTGTLPSRWTLCRDWTGICKASPRWASRCPSRRSRKTRSPPRNPNSKPARVLVPARSGEWIAIAIEANYFLVFLFYFLFDKLINLILNEICSRIK